MSYDYIQEANADLEEKFEETLLRKFPDSLLNQGDQIYIRNTGGRLMWLKANVHGGGQEWEEVTPTLAVKRRRESGDITDEESLVMLRDRLMAQEPESHEIGWYQDPNGDLYQFSDGKWVGATPPKTTIKALEYLG